METATEFNLMFSGLHRDFFHHLLPVGHCAPSSNDAVREEGEALRELLRLLADYSQVQMPWDATYS